MSLEAKLAMALALTAVPAVQATAGALASPEAEAVVAAPTVVPEFSWEGFYAGGMLGYGRGTAGSSFSETFRSCATPSTSGASSCFTFTNSSDSSNDASGLSGSIFVGHNWATGDNMFFGAEVELGASEATYELEAFDVSTGIQGAFRLRAGTAMDRTLLYVAGGVAVADVTAKNSDGSDSNTLVGWTAGIGAEYAFSDSLFGRLEVRHTDYGAGRFNVDGYAPDVDLKQTDLMVGIGFKF